LGAFPSVDHFQQNMHACMMMVDSMLMMHDDCGGGDE
jgi:hypothetical protein